MYSNYWFTNKLLLCVARFELLECVNFTFMNKNCICTVLCVFQVVSPPTHLIQCTVCAEIAMFDFACPFLLLEITLQHFFSRQIELTLIMLAARESESVDLKKCWSERAKTKTSQEGFQAHSLGATTPTFGPTLQMYFAHMYKWIFVSGFLTVNLCSAHNTLCTTL